MRKNRWMLFLSVLLISVMFIPTGVSAQDQPPIPANCDGWDSSQYPTTCGTGECASTGVWDCLDFGSPFLDNSCQSGTPTTEIPDDGLDQDCDGYDTALTRSVSIVDTSADAGTSAQVPVVMDDAASMQVFLFNVTYDPTVVECTGASPGDVTASGWIVTLCPSSDPNCPADVQLPAGEKQVTGLSVSILPPGIGGGTITNLHCDAIGNPGDSSLMGFGIASVNNQDAGEFDVMYNPGIFTVTGQACTTVDTTCDGVDDDCDGVVDDDYQGELITCGEGECANSVSSVCFNGRVINPPCTPLPTNACGECGAVPDEVCDGADNNCDGQIDEGVTNVCGECGAVPDEVCDGEDNNCDGQVDEGVTNACGECGAVPDEVCDGVDNNCNGTVDEGCDCINDDRQPCGSDTGECQSGMQTCINGQWGDCIDEVTPIDEICDGADNNCDGVIDEGVTNACGECGSVPDEVCDGVDNNCDGVIDEGCDGRTVQVNCPESDIGETFSVPVTVDDASSLQVFLINVQYDPGIVDCTSASTGDMTSAGWVVTLCPSADDNCPKDENGIPLSAADLGLAPTGEKQLTGLSITMLPAGVGGGTIANLECTAVGNRGDSTPMEITFAELRNETATFGVTTTDGVCTIIDCVPSAEVCDGIDNDCDGVVDEDYQGDTITCGIGECANSVSTVCFDGRVVTPPCTELPPSDEICDSKDNNCDGRTDEDGVCEPSCEPDTVPGDYDGDCDVDRDDLNILMADRNKTVGASACGQRCDLDGDGIITVLDSRKLVLMCTNPRCAIN